jgi:glycosyltransferase involved in cell wall biosynthesis
MNASDQPIIAICIATYKRPTLLLNCLNAIAKLVIPDQHQLFVVVVDNDHEQSARSTIQNLKNSNLRNLSYHVETSRGIASARNRLLNEAIDAKADFIAFIDDDEFPKPDWLITLFNALLKYSADVATGPVIALTEEGAAISTTEGKYKTGKIPRKVSTNNVLFKNKLIKEDKLTFDLRLNFCGGEDFDFFEKSSIKGNQHVWADGAIVFETIIKERTTTKYLFYRHFTGGINNVVQYRFSNGILKSWLHFLLKILGKIIGAMLSLLTFIVTFNKEKLEKSIVKFASVIGYLSGLLNIIVERYK